MLSNQISPFEYVSILVSIILGLGITQLLSAFSDLLYNYKKVTFYWPHNLWIIFILFLHIQDWFITYQLKSKEVWSLPVLSFVLLYPITLFLVSKMLLPTNESEEKFNMKSFYFSQFPLIYLVVCACIILSIVFNVLFIHKSYCEQLPLLVFFVLLFTMSFKKIKNELLHYVLSLVIVSVAAITTVIENGMWVIK